MANLFNKLLDYMNMSDNEEDVSNEAYNGDIDDVGDSSGYSDDMNDSDYSASYSEPEPEPVKPSRKSSSKERTRSSKVVSMSSVGGVSFSEIKIIKPVVYDDSKEICDSLAKGIPVILNLEGLGQSVAQRIFDFSLGCVYSIDGNFKNVSDYIFLATPKSVSVSGNFTDADKEGLNKKNNYGL